MKKLLLFLVAAATLALALSTPLSGELNSLINDYWEWRLSNAPEFASSINILTHNNQVESYSLEALEDINANVTIYLERLEKIDSSVLTSEEKMSYSILKDTLQTVIDGYRWRHYGALNPVNFMEGFLTDPTSNAIFGEFSSTKDFEDLSERMRGWANELGNMQTRMTKAIVDGTTNHRVSVEPVLGQIQKILTDDPSKFVLYDPYNGTLENLASINATEKESLRTEAKAAINVLLDSMRNLSTYISQEYMNHTRKSFGVNSLPNGEEFYRACLRWHLSVDMTPEEVHEKGLQEVERISGKMKNIMKRLGHSNLTVAEFFTMLNNNDNYHLNTSEEILDGYRSIIKDRIGKKLPEYFRDIPDMPAEVEAMTYDGAGGQYMSGSPDGTRPGVFQANVIRPRDTSTYGMVSLALHETDPGHHLQDIYSQASKTLPTFRKVMDYTKYFSVPYHFPFYTSYTEGWALYSEALGEELGIYEGDYELMGRYSSEIFRACRLVIDTGLHHYNWTNDQAKNYMMNYTADSEQSIITEINRYITWPGQACAYKIGELKIRELREKAKSQLGERFDIRDFHFVVLNNGAVPLAVLEELVDDWIETKIEANKRLTGLMKDFFDWRMEINPEFATGAGVNKYNDRLETISVTLNSEYVAKAREFQMRLLSIPRGELSSDNVISRDVLENVLETYINGSEWGNYGILNPFNFIEGLIHQGPSGFYTAIPFYTQGDLTNYVRRLELLSQQYDEKIELARLAITHGTTNNNVSMNRVPEQIERFNASEFLIPFNLYAGKLFNGTSSTAIEQRLLSAIHTINDTLVQVKDFLVNEYIPKTRSSLGVGGLPRGLEYYQACLKWHTSLDYTPDQVRDIGMKEVKRIEADMKKTIKRLGYPANMTIREFYQNMQTNSSFLIHNGEETLDRFREIIFHRIQPVLPKYFKDIPGLPLVVQNSASDGISGEYESGSSDGSIPGTFFANVRRPEDNPTYAMVSLCLHEALPGHHLADSYSLVSDLPNFRKYSDWKSYNVPFHFPYFNSYVEGWALYAEYLGIEMGIYHNDYELMGRYSDEMWRACRLVIDTGIHAFNWTREDAIKYMMDRTSITRQTAEIEIDRYTTWPGQACGYKLGELKIKELRQKSTEQLGDRFDLRDFHYVVLSNGAVPLDVLEHIVDDWIERTKSDHVMKTPSPCSVSGSNSFSGGFLFVSMSAMMFQMVKL